jgi:hypothetical protein
MVSAVRLYGRIISQAPWKQRAASTLRLQTSPLFGVEPSGMKASAWSKRGGSLGFGDNPSSRTWEWGPEIQVHLPAFQPIDVRVSGRL